MKTKKVMAVMMAAAMTMGMLAGCGNSSDNGATASGGTTSEEAKDTTGSGSTDSDTSDLAGTQITLLNSKGEIQTALEEMAEAFEEDTGISVEVQACGTGESPYTKVTSAYNLRHH